MLSRDRRLHTAKDFTRVWRTGRVLRGRAMMIRISLPTGQQSKYGFIVSTAVAKKATIRNRIKRRMRAIARQLPASPPADIVVYATKASAGASYAALDHEMRTLLTPHHAPPPYRRH